MIKGIDGLLDKAWSELVKLLAKNRCAFCGSEVSPEAHHIHVRKNMATRWHLDNGICLCSEHHTDSSVFSAHKTPKLFMDWLIKLKGVEFVESLNRLAHTTVKRYEFEKKELLKELRGQINELNNPK